MQAAFEGSNGDQIGTELATKEIFTVWLAGPMDGFATIGQLGLLLARPAPKACIISG
jgi:hypothetical protein